MISIIFLAQTTCFHFFSSFLSSPSYPQGSGAAFETQDLHVGHIILEVDCISTVNLPHHQIAQMIADAYYHTPHKDFIEFVVREKSKHEFDIRRSSFMLLNTSFE